MPTTINGVGTRYVGRKNLSQQPGVCDQCGREATLSSYDTRLFFCFVFIPVVPLARKRVMDDCSRCRQHRVMPLDAYRRFQSETLSDLQAATTREPASAEAALAYNGALFEFGRAEEGRRHLDSVLRSFPNHAEVLFYAAAHHERTGDGAEATRLFDRAYDADPSYAPARRAKAFQLVQQGQLSEARSLLFAGGAEEARDPAVLFLLGKAFQERSDHMTALEVFRKMMEEFPGTAQDKEVRRAVKASEKAVGSPTTALPGRQRAWGKAAAVAALVVALAGGAVAYDLYQKSHCPLHVVNAFPGPVMVEIGDAPGVAVPMGRTELEVPEGVHAVRISGGFEETVEIDLRRTLGQRFGSSPLFVLNPGGLGVLISEETLYSAGDAPDYDPPTRLLAGKRFFDLRGVDYRFREFPESIELSSSRSSVTKRRLDVLDGEPLVLTEWLHTYGDAGETLDYLEGWIRVSPEGPFAEAYAGTALIAGQAARAAAFLRARLELGPINVEWHRAYQEAAGALEGGTQSLVAEYDGYLAAEPGSSELLYLRGRIEPDPRRAERFHRRALAADPGNRFARRGAAWVSTALGEFDAASEVTRDAATSETAEEPLLGLYHEALLAAGRYRRLEGELRAGLAQDPTDWARARRLVLALARDGRSAEALETVQELGERERAELGEDSLLGPWLRALLLYADGDWAGLDNHISQPRFPQFWRDFMAYWVAIETGDVQAAAGLSRRDEEPSDKAVNGLVLGLLYAREGMTGMSDECIAKGLEGLPHQQDTVRVFEELLAGERPLTRANVELLVTDPSVKAAMLTVLATRHPEQREWLLAEADRFNFNPAFPYHFLRSFQA